MNNLQSHGKEASLPGKFILYIQFLQYNKSINKTDSLSQNTHIKFPWASDKSDKYAETPEL